MWRRGFLNSQRISQAQMVTSVTPDELTSETACATVVGAAIPGLYVPSDPCGPDANAKQGSLMATIGKMIE
jgi:hypothetical protein